MRANRIELALLSPDFYVRPDIAEREEREIFRKSWIYVGPAAWVSAAGEFFTTTLCGVPIVVIRCSAENIIAFVNICLHRGHPVAAQRGVAAGLRCSYHGWVYSLEGRLCAVPGVSSAVRDAELSLQPIQVRRWGPLLFVSLAPSPLPFEEWVGNLPRTIEASGVQWDGLVFDRRSPWLFAANWKVGIENFLECSHCAFVHPLLARVLDVRMGEIRLESSRWTSSQLARAHADAAKIVGSSEVIADAQDHYLWPATTMSITPGEPNLVVHTWLPQGPGRTVGYGDTFFGVDVAPDAKERFHAYMDTVIEEDDRIVEALQHSLSSGMMTESRILSSEERLLVHFQELVVEHIR